MSLVFESSKAARWLAGLMAVAAMGGLMRWLEPTSPTLLRANAITAWAGQGLVPAMLGGLRPAVAAGCWLRTNLAWEARDEAATIAWIELTLATDDRDRFYRLNAARMIAYDFPTWPRRPRGSAVPDYSERALRLLEEGLRPGNSAPALLIEMANIHLRVRGDREAAAGFYRRAAVIPGAPYYAARIHGELLVALGRPREALDWLRRVRQSLPADDPAARVAVVDARIRALETGGTP